MTILSICTDKLDRLKPCAFVAFCHRSRQELHHRLRIQGTDCCFYIQHSEKRLVPESGIPQEKNEQ